jgi:hypothetical protein
LPYGFPVPVFMATNLGLVGAFFCASWNWLSFTAASLIMAVSTIA